ncbi:MAG: TRAP transporter substrate-binding protein DctP [Candidatus Aminicenantes bacterium]|nr:TRAP transporter substrate-binding protein DctP [Candidatus Aminicenantes bacterium]
MNRKILLVALLSLFLLTGTLNALVIKIGSIAPDRSPWDKAIKKLGREWGKISEGKIKFKIYAGGIVGNEKDMIRKMRLGKLGGAALTNMGIIHIFPETFVLNTPLLLTSEKELDYIFEKMKPFFEKGIEEKGFKVVIWTLTGWINFFSKSPVLLPEDLKKHKISFTTGAPDLEQAWKKAGFHIVPNDLKDLTMGLESGMVNAFYLPPLMAASGQYFAQAPNMLTLKVSPLLGGIVLSKAAWKKIPNQYKKKMMDAAAKVAKDLYREILKLEEDALTEMKKHKLVINDIPPGGLETWRTAVNKGMDVLIGKAFSKEVYDQIMKHLAEYREVHEN